MPEAQLLSPDETFYTILSDRLWEAAQTHTPCDPLTRDCPDLSIEQAYCIATVNLQRLKALGHRIVGYKIGLTNPFVQAQLGINQPDFGTLTDDLCVPDGSRADYGRLLQPRVEGEIAFVLKKPLRGPGVTVAHVIAATDFVLAAIEIVDSRIANWDIRAADTIADNASTGLFVLGSRPSRLDALDLRLLGMCLRLNGDVAATGAGAACLGNPLVAVSWLANKLGELGSALEAGHIVLSGALCPFQPLLPGDHVEIQLSGLGTVNVGL